MIKAVIFDCFGVLVSEAWLGFKERNFGHDSHLEEEAANLMQQADAGLLSHEDFIEGIAKMSGKSQGDVMTELDQNLPNQPLFDYISEEIRPKYKIGMLSNAAADWLKQLLSSDQLALFDVFALSYETGIPKPDSRAYLQVAEQLGVEPSECVFIDDQERHCTGARETGMQAVWYQSFEQGKADLEKILA